WAERGSVRAVHVHCIRSAPAVDIVVISVKLDIPRIEQVDAVLVRIGAAGVDAVAVVRAVGIKRCALILPVHQIAARIMSPELQPAVYVKRSVLEKYVVHAAVLAQTVRIVEPADRRHQMAAQPPGAVRNSLCLLLQTLFLQKIS